MSEKIRISVADTGPAIPPSLDIFALFETTKPMGPALGWRLQGKLWSLTVATSTLNLGFRMAPSSTLISPTGGAPCEDLMVLVLDDEGAFLEALGELLRDDGHPVQAYRSIADLPPLSELPSPAAVITDHQLEGSEDGLSFARRFHAAHPGAPVIIVTAFATDHLTQSVAALPYVSLLRKPLQYENLHELLHERCASSTG
jgi:CheY-like chemotaxis protein